MSTLDTWILVSVPAPGTGRGIAVRLGLRLLGWSERRSTRRTRSVALDRVERPALAARPFC